MARLLPWHFSVRLSVLLFVTLQPVSLRLLAQEQTSAPEKLPSAADQDQQTTAAPEHDEDDLLFPLKRDLWFQRQRAYPNLHIPPGAYWAAQKEKEALVARHLARLKSLTAPLPAADPLSGVTWTADGPQPVAAYYGPVPYSGRATSIAVHPTDPNTVYLGTAGGGVWKTTDGGQTWNPLTDSQASLAIGAVAIDPNNPETVFVGTGEPDFSGDSYYGQGLLKSTDGGATWTLIRTPFTSGLTCPDFTAIAVQKGNSNVVLAATEGGLYRSADGGTTWTVVLVPGYPGAGAVMFDVVNPTTAYAAAAGYYSTSPGPVFMSTDSGQTWTAIAGSGTTALPTPNLVLRISLTETADGKTLFAAFANSSFTAPGTVYATTNSGTSWTKLSSPSTSDGLDWYRNALVVSPTNSQVLFASGVGLYQSTNGGLNWTQVSGSPVYADQHAFAFSADGSRMYVADDGGIFVTTQPTASNPGFSSLNADINTLTSYPGFSIIPNKPNSALAGSQDHGLNLYTGTLAWPNGEQSGFCGDAGAAYVDPFGQYAYAHCQGGPANWAANATADGSTTSWVAAQTGINKSDPWPWVSAIEGDQLNPSIVYTVTNHLYQSTNHAQSWTSISPDLTAGQATLSAIGVSPTNSNTVYTGSYDGTVSVTTNAASGASATWTTLTRAVGGITKIVVQPDSPQDVYMTVSALTAGAHVYHSTNGGTSWQNITGDLPNTPTNSIAVDPDLANTLYVATDIGVFVSENGGTNWLPLGQGLPNVVIQDILLYEPTRTLRVITHGRGAWDAVLPGQGSGLSSFTVNSSSLGSGATATFTVTLTAPAPAAGAAINLLSNNSSAFPVVSPFSMSAGQTTATFTQKAGTATSLTNVTISAAYNGTVMSVPIAINPALLEPVLTVSPSLASITTIQGLAVTVAVSGGTGNPTPTGSVLLSSGNYTSSPVTLSAGGATINIPAGSLAAGSDTLTVSYTPDSPSSSTYSSNTGSASVTVTKMTPTVTVMPSLSSITTAQALAVPVTVSGGSGTPTATGSVTLTGGGYTSAATPLVSGSATINIPAGSLAVGSDTLTATYSGDGNYNTAPGAAPVVTVAKATPTVTVTPSSSSISVAQALSVPVTVSGGAGAPAATGSVTLSSGSYTSAATSLASGGVTINIPAGSLAAGADTLTASYGGDSNYNASSGTAPVSVESFTVTATAVTVAPGATTGNTSTVSVMPVGGFTGSVTLSASLTSSPSGATDLPTLSFGSTSPVSITGASAAVATLTVATTAPTNATLVFPEHPRGRLYKAGGAVLAFIVLAFVPGRRRALRMIVGTLILLVFLTGGVVSCGKGGGGSSGSGGAGTNTNPGTTGGPYTVTITGTDAATGKITSKTTVNVTVN